MANRYWRRGVGKVLVATAVADPTSPTRSEITAAVDVTPQLVNPTITHEIAAIATPGWVSTFTPTIPGEETGSLTILAYDLDGTTDAVRAAMPKDTALFVLIFPKGDSVGKRMEVWPARTGAGPVDDYAADNEAARYSVSFTPTAPPNRNVSIPA